ncbi:MAG TPA: hypothetical protein PLA45_02450 [Candidatus Dojkabacteria bacterium]|nr:hypothetical protein [Candidatus Dojkabacteria bacterium]
MHKTITRIFLITVIFVLIALGIYFTFNSVNILKLLGLPMFSWFYTNTIHYFTNQLQNIPNQCVR